MTRRTDLSAVRHKPPTAARVSTLTLTYQPPETPALKNIIANANNGKRFAQIICAKKQWSQESARLQALKEAINCFDRASSLASDPIMRIYILGNQTYASFLHGQWDEARRLLNEALGTLYKATLQDA